MNAAISTKRNEKGTNGDGRAPEWKRHRGKTLTLTWCSVTARRGSVAEAPLEAQRSEVLLCILAKIYKCRVYRIQYSKQVRNSRVVFCFFMFYFYSLPWRWQLPVDPICGDAGVMKSIYSNVYTLVVLFGIYWLSICSTCFILLGIHKHLSETCQSLDVICLFTLQPHHCPVVLLSKQLPRLSFISMSVGSGGVSAGVSAMYDSGTLED